MSKDGGLALLRDSYIENSGMKNFPQINFNSYDDAQTITAALTGDIPPIDYVDTAGMSAGFNTALMAEIGRRLHLNIKTIFSTHAVNEERTVLFLKSSGE